MTGATRRSDIEGRWLRTAPGGPAVHLDALSHGERTFVEAALSGCTRPVVDATFDWFYPWDVQRMLRRYDAACATVIRSDPQELDPAHGACVDCCLTPGARP